MEEFIKKDSVRRKLWLFASIVFLLVSGFEAYFLYMEKEQLKKDFFREASASLQNASSAIALSMWLYQSDFVSETLKPFDNKPDVAFLNLSDKNNKRLFGIQDENFVPLIDEFKQQDVAEYDSEKHLLIRETINYNDEVLGYLIIGFSRQWLEDKIANRVQKTVIVTAALAIILIILTLIFSHILSRPLHFAHGIIREYLDRENLPEDQTIFSDQEILSWAEKISSGNLPSPDVLFQLTPVPLLISDATGKIKNANRSACRFFEKNHPDLLETALETLIGENDFKIIKNHISSSQSYISGYLSVIPSQSGKKRITEINIALLHNKDDTLKGFIVAFLDVSDNFQTQQEILENQTRTAALNQKLLQKARELENAHEKNIKYARKLAQLIKISYDIIRCNSNGEIMNILVTGGTQLLDAEECMVFLCEGQKNRLEPVKTFPEKIVERLKPIMENDGVIWKTYRENHSQFLNERSLKAQDFNEMGFAALQTLDLIAVPVSDEDYHYGVAVYLQHRKNILFTEDMHLITALAHQSAITLDKIQLFEALKEKAQHLEKANADLRNSQQQVIHLQKMESLGTLVAGIAHDFNNIMGIIIPNIDLLRISAGDNQDVLKRAYTIQKAAERAAELNRQMLMFSRTHEIKLAPLSPNQLMRQIVGMLRKALNKNISVQLRLDPSMPDINADEDRLSQVLMNLALNARDAMPKGGSITFTTAVEDYVPSTEPNKTPEKHVRITINDTGPGITMANLEKIFDPFFTTKSVDKGTGLGLSVVYGIIKSHEGHIEVESEVNKGTTFHLYFKPIEIEEEQSPEPQYTASSNGNEKILIVDDEKMILDMLSELLETLGYRVLMAESGKEAVEKARRNNGIHIAIVEYTMPKMNGLETIKAIHQTDSSIRILLSSGYADQAKIIHKYSNIDGFLPKPYHINEVAKIIKDTLKKGLLPKPLI
jgi:PAS domain S-box-containing protein